MSDFDTVPNDPDLYIKNQICVALYQASHKVSRLYGKILEPHALTFPQYQVLLALWECDGRSIGTLCTMLDLDTSTITPTVRRLEQNGYVNRFRDRLDERRVHVLLTDKGKTLRKEAKQMRFRLIDSLGPDASMLADLLPLLRKLSTMIEQIDATTLSEPVS